MTAAFADTSFYVACFNPTDRFHQKATEIAECYDTGFVTSEYVLVELGNYFSVRDRAIFVAALHLISQDPETDVIPASQWLFNAGAKLYRDRQDKQWSLTDCISFCIMRDRGLHGALTYDHHFSQAGFQMLTEVE